MALDPHSIGCLPRRNVGPPRGTAARSRCRPTSRRAATRLPGRSFHGRAGQLYQRYQDGMEDQIGALGLVLNALVLFSTRYMDSAVTQLRADGFDVRICGRGPSVAVRAAPHQRAGPLLLLAAQLARRPRCGLRTGR